MEYQLEKLIWNEQDFSQMGWHDCRIYAITTTQHFELILDIDYIFKCVLEEPYYKFWVSPCTLIFENVLNINFKSSFHNSQLEIDSIIKRTCRNPANVETVNKKQWNYVIELHNGSISFQSVGYTQFVRSLPILSTTQSLGLEMRNGISFATNCFTKCS